MEHLDLKDGNCPRDLDGSEHVQGSEFSTTPVDSNPIEKATMILTTEVTMTADTSSFDSLIGRNSSFSNSIIEGMKNNGILTGNRNGRSDMEENDNKYHKPTITCDTPSFQVKTRNHANCNDCEADCISIKKLSVPMKGISTDDSFYSYDVGRTTTIPDLLYSRQILGSGCGRLYRRKIGYSVVNTYLLPLRKFPRIFTDLKTADDSRSNKKIPTDTENPNKEHKKVEECPNMIPSDNQTKTFTSIRAITNNLFFDPMKEILASRVAWGLERMRNMVVAVGPGTPASLCWFDRDGEDDETDYDEFEGDDDEDDEGDSDDDDDGDRMSIVSVDIEDEEEHVNRSSDDEERVMLQFLESQVMSTQEEVQSTYDQGDKASEDDEDDKTIGDARRPRMASTSAPGGSISASGDRNGGDVEEDAQDEDRSGDSNTRTSSSDDVAAGVGDSTSFEEIARREIMRQIQRQILANISSLQPSNVGNDNNENSNINNRDEHMDDSDDGMNDDDIALFRSARNFIFNASRDHMRTERSDSHLRHSSRSIANKKKTWSPSIRHGGCINTASWLTCPWRLSSTKTSLSTGSATSISHSTSFINSAECPTQIVTSGDDKLIKFWDIRDAMGMSNPLPGGFDTFAPLADSKNPCSAFAKAWRNHYNRSNPYFGNKRQSRGRDNDDEMEEEVCDEDSSKQESYSMTCQQKIMHGGVNHLASVNSGHRGNVFHITPINEKPGQVVSCGADGFLRLVNLQNEESSIIIHPFVTGEDSDDDGNVFFVCVGMAFSHLMLTANTGLLCSERGLHHFDVRLSPRQQQQQSLWNTDRSDSGPHLSSSRFQPMACKACVTWSPHGIEQTDPNYFFAGGANAVVDLFDIRMDSVSNNQRHRKVLQRYKPRNLSGPGNVSVSGLDVTKDGRELLVSYENDQIYTFPIFPNSSSCAGPDLDEIDAAAEAIEKYPDRFVPELAGYGGHLNRFTFLKNPKYAGPNDEYICTGSDSGNAWIYEKRTGTVVSLLGADARTCNGIIPHPTLPYFITYGIESTAKIWRAATPVDLTADDTRVGRRRAILSNLEHELSPVARSWDGVQMLLKRFDKEPAIMPDFVATSEEIASSGHFSSRSQRGILGPITSPRIGNALRNLPMILRQNRYECYRAFHDERMEGGPIEQPLIEFTHRVCIQRLKRQADSLGVTWNPRFPWVFQQSPYDSSSIPPAELVPDNPSDWLLLDGKMTLDHISPRCNFNTNEYGSLLLELFPEEDFTESGLCELVNTSPWLSAEQQNIDSFDESISWPVLAEERSIVKNPKTDKESKTSHANDAGQFDIKRSRKLLLETVVVLKEGGNIAMKERQFQNAAKHYDKAIQYCAVAFMQYLEGTNKFKHLTARHHAMIGPSPNINNKEPATVIIAVWSPLLRLLITSRLNMALLLLKPEMSQPPRSADQARHALKLLAPFTRQEGYVVTVVRRKLHVLSKDEPSETYWEALSLQAKAHFRLGSAELEMADYAGAVKSFEQSLKSEKKKNDCSKGNQVPDALLVKRLHEAKRKHCNKKKRDRKRYQRLIAEDEQHQEQQKPKDEHDDDDDDDGSDM